MNKLLRALLLAPFLVTFAACGGTADPTGTEPGSTDTPPESTGTPPEQLEALSVSGVTDTNEMALEGTLQISGAERDYAVVVAGLTDGEQTLQIHTPSMADLSTLGGQSVAVTLEQSTGTDPTTRSVVITDQKGPVYVGDLGYGVDQQALFGKTIVSFGDAVATEIVDLKPFSGYLEKTYTKLAFKGDEGDVQVGAGEVASVTIGGVLYRVSVIGAIDVQYHTDEALGCGESDSMSYEMLRIAAAPAALKLVRPANLSPFRLACVGP